MTNNEAVYTLYNSLKPVQKDMYQSFVHSKDRKFVVHCSRRLGKTYLLCVISAMKAYSKSDAQVRYAAFTQKALRKMILPIFKELFNKLPKKIRPEFNVQEGAYRFQNGSQIHLAGVNNGQSDNLRGTSADLALIDEAAFVDDLTYLTESVLMPQLLTVPHSKLIMASSSPLSPAHEFVEYINQAKVNNFYASYSIHDAGYDEELVHEFCVEAGGANSTTWKREYLNAVITDETMAIIPEWNTEYVKNVGHDKFFNFYHKYCAGDWGVRDKTAILWAYYDFKQAKLIVEHEFTCSGQDSTTRNIAENIKSIESTIGYGKLYMRPADNNNLILLQDLSNEFGIYFSPTTKDTLPAMVNEVRLWVQSGRLIVNPRCKELISCLEFGIFENSKREQFGRSKALGHYDALAALVYLIRNIDQSTNPIPQTHGYTQQTWSPILHEEVSVVNQIFNIRK